MNMAGSPKILALALSLMMMSIHAGAQRIARFEVQVGTRQVPLELPVHVSLDGVTDLPDSVLQLVEVTKGLQRKVDCQIELNGNRMLYWIIDPMENQQKTRVYELIRSNSREPSSVVGLKDENGHLLISSRHHNLLQYNYATMYPPPGVDTVYRRSGFIHPLWSPRGQELTRVHAPDHYHHWGLWNPWTEVLFEGDSVDFWNLARKQGTVRFANFISRTSGPVYAEFKALHEHVAFQKAGEKVALNEVQTVRIYEQAADQNYYIMDITVQLNCASSSPVELLEYRYGGLGLRATEEWNRDNSNVLTSEGKTRKEADGSRARWCMVQGAVKNDQAGLVMMSCPTNYNYPEPLRVWPEDMNKRGDVFLNFSPTKNMNWLLSPGKDYLLRYRFLVFNDACSKEKAELAWKDFAQPPVITIKRL